MIRIHIQPKGRDKYRWIRNRHEPRQGSGSDQDKDSSNFSPEQGQTVRSYEQRRQTDRHEEKLDPGLSTVCPRSSDPFYIVS